MLRATEFNLSMRIIFVFVIIFYVYIVRQLVNTLWLQYCWYVVLCRFYAIECIKGNSNFFVCSLAL